ncbi:hypothetical protein IMCC14465_09180 [alpha proteobacterium IMCC14465]|uniref:PpiC domain-containing protein n=1 Tax=alpha proteobacterium IMCC14465 TaxID=1220535 RepID=J9DVU8_9PROT|nr:hypothetical protein IMCC14465_09180 [alpha proteobacterium IMCC14465]
MSLFSQAWRGLSVFIREPLAVFIIFSAGLYGVFLVQKPADETLIIVSEARLQEFYQYKRQSFGLPAIANKLEVMSTGERDALIEDFIREEVLVREARRMGLDAGDFIIRQRLIQKLEFLADTQADTAQKAEALLPDWYGTHQENYRQPAEISFTHIYFAKPDETTDANVEAARVLSALKRDPSLPIAGLGDRFLYHKSYQRKSQADIAGHFGDDFALAVFELSENEAWQGPLASRHGHHLVRVVDKAESKIPRLADVREKVLFDLKLSLSEAARQAHAERLQKKYTVIYNQ